jgi:hypothetical protein
MFKERQIMANETPEGGQGAWLVKPPAHDEIQFQIAVGEGVEVTPAVREALDRLLVAFQQSDVEGYRKTNPVPCPELNDCKTFYCNPLSGCRLQRLPCAMNTTCEITKNIFG